MPNVLDLDCDKKKVKQLHKMERTTVDRAADGINVIHCYLMNGKQRLIHFVSLTIAE